MCSDLSAFFYVFLSDCDFKKYFSFQQFNLNRFQCFRIQCANVVRIEYFGLFRQELFANLRFFILPECETFPQPSDRPDLLLVTSSPASTGVTVAGWHPALRTSQNMTKVRVMTFGGICIFIPWHLALLLRCLKCPRVCSGTLRNTVSHVPAKWTWPVRPADTERHSSI